MKKTGLPISLGLIVFALLCSSAKAQCASATIENLKKLGVAPPATFTQRPQISVAKTPVFVDRRTLQKMGIPLPAEGPSKPSSLQVSAAPAANTTTLNTKSYQIVGNKMLVNGREVPMPMAAPGINSK